MQNRIAPFSKSTTVMGCLAAIALYEVFWPLAFAQPAPENSGNRVLDEIIVVAQKREQNIQVIPVSVSALDAEMIRQSRMTSIVKLTELHPSVSFDNAQSFQNSSLKIRGIGTFGNTRSFEGAVGVFVDGVFRPRSGMALAELLDIDSLEVIRGPQGTLFGKNTVAGTVALYSSKPDLEAVNTEVELRLGNFNSRYIRGIFNTPISDSSAFRIAGSFNQREGSFGSPDNGDTYNDTDRYAVKFQFLTQPNEDLDFGVIIDHAKSDANCCWSGALAAEGPTSPLIEAYTALNGLSYFAPPLSEKNRAASLNSSPREIVEDTGLTATLNWDLGRISIESITSVRDWKNDQLNGDGDFSAVRIFTLSEPARIQTTSQQVNFSIPFGDSNDLLVGIYIADEDYDSTRSIRTGADADNYVNALISAGQGAVACLPPLVADDCLFPVGIGALFDTGEFTAEHFFQESQSLGLFAHSIFSLAEKLELVAGIRYSEEDKDGGVENLFWYDSPIARAALEAAGIPDDGTPRNGLDLVGSFNSPSFLDATRDSEVSGTVSLQYFLTNDVMFYGGYHRGYKAGGVNLMREAIVTNTPTYRPETAKSIEIGMKSTYWNTRARTNLAVFSTDFSDLQINFFTGLEFITENTGTARTQGIEIENFYQLTDELRVDFSVTYLDSRFKTILNPFLSYLADRETPRAPDWASVLTLMYEKPISSKLNFFARSMTSYTGSHYVGADVATEEKVRSYLINDLTVGITSRDERWDLLLWCNNCGNQDYRTIYFNSVFQPGTYSSYLNDPRQYGMTFRTRF